MTTKTIDNAKFDKVVRILEMLARMCRNQSDRQGEWLYYSLLANCFRQIQQARVEGKTVVGHTIFAPTEILYAMDIVPMYLEGAGEIMARMLGLEESFGVAKSAGFASEICSGHRLLNAMAYQGWLPRADAFVWSNLVCDLTAKSGDYLVKEYDRPGYYLDRPYRDNPEGRQYYVRELEGLISFLEDLTKKKLDRDRLSQVMENTRRSTLVFREICELRKSVPSPMRSHHLIEMTLAQLLLSGTPELVHFYEVVRDEIKEEMQKPDRPSERYRLINFFFYPSYLWKFLNTMETRYHASMITEPHLTLWADADIDPSRPLESLASKAFALTDTGPLSGVAEKIVRDARAYKADGALYWAHMGCRQTCATIKIIKDALLKEGVPTLVVDCDLADATIVSEDEITAKVEQFLELLDDRRED
jgi:benzoyl-CoA reductase/2-hydroxyglutaryl-CoA dehydratase subunit BcrC/BadD/HgdB